MALLAQKCGKIQGSVIEFTENKRLIALCGKRDFMLVSLIPLFDENKAVAAYSIFTQKDNFLLNPMMLGTGHNDGASRLRTLEFVEKMGIDTLSSDKVVFVPITNISIFADIENECTAPRDRLVLLIDNTVPPVDMYINRLKELKDGGYKLAIRKLAVSEYENYKEVLKLMDYVFLNNKKVALDKAKIFFSKLYPNVQLCAGNIETAENFEAVKALGGFAIYEGDFYRMPVTAGDNEVSPIKVNYIRLLNIVNDSNFELTEAADVIGHDTALTLSLLKLVNRMARNSEITSIRHAAAMLGQRELKKWINTAVVNALYKDKPNEITRLSLIRAKFAENLAKAFELAIKSEELFLMGLFSVLDVILDKSMEEALEMVKVSKDIGDALISGSGKLAPVLDFVKQYENANWSEISRLMILYKIDLSVVEKAYEDTLIWYRNLVEAKV